MPVIIYLCKKTHSVQPSPNRIFLFKSLVMFCVCVFISQADSVKSLSTEVMLTYLEVYDPLEAFFMSRRHICTMILGCEWWEGRISRQKCSLPQVGRSDAFASHSSCMSTQGFPNVTWESSQRETMGSNMMAYLTA